MCSNCNNMNSFNNPNMSNVGLVVENGNNTVSTTASFNNDVLNNNSNSNNYNSYPCNHNNSSCPTNDILNANFNNNSNCNNTCGCTRNGNNSCGCNDGCNCNGNNSCGCNDSCNCNGATLGENTTRSTLQNNLKNFIGRRVTLEFNTNGNCTKKTGVLTCVGCNFVTLRGTNNNCLVADTNCLTFVTVHNSCN